MDLKTFKEKILQPKLAEAFGSTTANMLITVATLDAVGGATEGDKQRIMVDSICANQKVVAMWGEKQTAIQKAMWLKMVT
jgi:hypothetical protein